MVISVLLADDHEIVRLGLKRLLEPNGIKVQGEASSGKEVIPLLQEHKYDLVLMDVRMDNGDGLQAFGRLSADYPDLPVLFLSAFDNPTYIARSVALGAKGFVLKSETPQHIVSCVKQVAAGEDCWKKEELRRVTGALTAPRLSGNADVPLTQRESEVLKLVTDGLTNKEIASVLSISYETVKEHVQHILRKVGVSDRTQAAVWAVRNGVF